MQDQEYFMRKALENAKKSYDLKEVPVGAVIVLNGEIISEGFNTRETGKNALHHAEILAIHRACEKLGGWRLHECDMFVTMEPCPMCAGAIVNARIKRLYFGTKDLKAGCFGTICNFNSMNFNHKPALFEGLLQQECAQIISDFFRELRKSKSSKN